MFKEVGPLNSNDNHRDQEKARLSAVVVPGSDVADLLHELSSRAAASRLRVRGDSMWPFIRDGDVVTIHHGPHETIQTGDVVAARHPHSRQLKIHRVLRKEKEGCFLKGDNAAAADGFIPFTEVFGKVSSVERSGQAACFGSGTAGRCIALGARIGLIRLGIAILSRLRAFIPAK